MIRAGQEYYSFSSIEISPYNTLGNENIIGVFTTLKSIDYEHGRPIEPIYNYAHYYDGYMKGRYKASATIGMSLDEQQKFHLFLQKFYGSVFDAGPFDFAIKLGKYGNDGSVIQHTIDMVGCHILQDKLSSKSQDPFIDVQIPLYVREIIKDGVRPLLSMTPGPTLIELLKIEREEGKTERQARFIERKTEQQKRRDEIWERITVPKRIQYKVLELYKDMRG